MKFKDLKQYLSRVARISVCFRDGHYENYTLVSDIPEGMYDKMYVFGVGKIDEEFLRDMYRKPDMETPKRFSGADDFMGAALEVVIQEHSREDVGVCFLNDWGVWVDKHINPLYLEIYDRPLCGGDERQRAYVRAMEAFGEYWYYRSRGTRAEDALAALKRQVVQMAEAYQDACLGHNGGEYRYFQRLLAEMNREDFEARIPNGQPIRAYNVGCMLPYMDYEPRTLAEIISDSYILLANV